MTFEIANGFTPEGLTVLLKKRNGKTIVAYDSTFKGTKSFHIRALFEDDDGKWHPTKEGVSIPITEKEDFIAALAKLVP
jgi:hypothetical protein